jgi:hypothetical protein
MNAFLAVAAIPSLPNEPLKVLDTAKKGVKIFAGRFVRGKESI